MRLTGLIFSFNRNTGYGFVRGVDGKTYFISRNRITSGSPIVGLPCSFDIDERPHKGTAQPILDVAIYFPQDNKVLGGEL
jgi:cold shock CspA family protein